MSTLVTAQQTRLDYQALKTALVGAFQDRPEPRRLPRLLEELTAAGRSFDDIEARRAVWSLIADRRLELTSDWRLSLP